MVDLGSHVNQLGGRRSCPGRPGGRTPEDPCRRRKCRTWRPWTVPFPCHGGLELGGSPRGLLAVRSQAALLTEADIRESSLGLVRVLAGAVGEVDHHDLDSPPIGRSTATAGYEVAAARDQRDTEGGHEQRALTYTHSEGHPSVSPPANQREAFDPEGLRSFPAVPPGYHSVTHAPRDGAGRVTPNHLVTSR